MTIAVGLLLAALLRPLPVEVVRPGQGTVRRTVEGPGTVQAHIVASVGTRITGVLTATLVDQGDSVARGEVLARLDDRDLRARVDAAEAAVAAGRDGIDAAEAAVARAEAEAELARTRHARTRSLVESGVLARDELDGSTAALRNAESAVESAAAELAAGRSRTRSSEAELRYATTLLSHTSVVAPFDGLVVAREAEVGDTLLSGTPIFELVDPTTLWVALRVDESVVGLVCPGQAAEIVLRSGTRLDGHVARIGHRSDPTMRELEVNVTFDRPPPRIVLNEEARVAIGVAEEEGMTVPVSVLLQGEAGPGVLVVREGRAEYRRVRPGLIGRDAVLVEEGLLHEDLVVVHPRGIEAGQRVRAVEDERD